MDPLIGDALDAMESQVETALGHALDRVAAHAADQVAEEVGLPRLEEGRRLLTVLARAFVRLSPAARAELQTVFAQLVAEDAGDGG